MIRPGESDLNGLTEGVFATRVAFRPSRPERGDLVVVRWRGEPRMLVPRDGARAASGVVNSRPRLARAREARMRRALGLAFRTGLPQLLLGRRGPIVLGPGDHGPAAFVRFLQAHWESRVTAVGFSVRALTANHKPTFVAVDRRGSALGFGKIAGNAGARERLGAEAEALQALTRRPVAGLRSPEVLAELEWRGEPVLVVQPIPNDAMRHVNAGPAPVQLVRAAQAHGVVLDPVERADDLVQTLTDGATPLRDAAATLAERLRSRLGGVRLAAGRTHGDLVPWNVATTRTGVLWAWDWEHSLAVDAVATDVVHWHVQLERHPRGRGLIDAHTVAEPQAERELLALGHGPDEVLAVRWLARLLVVSRWAALGRASAAAGRADPEAGLAPAMCELLDWR